MEEINFSVDGNKCIHCGLCEKDCIAKIIKYNENQIPFVSNPEKCIKCQHCLAICPVGAISILEKNPDESDKIYSQNPDMILNLIKSRRSIRQFKKEDVNSETMHKLKDMLAWTPTGCNYHKLHISFIENLEVMNEFRDYVNNKLINALTKSPIKAVTEKFSNYTNALVRGDDVIFRGAPHLIVVSNSVSAPCLQEDGIIALSYFELYAQSLGLGTCWCGFATMCLKLFPELCEYLKIPEGYKPCYTMLFGEKSINYSRITQPNNYSITSASKGGFENLSAGKKVKRYFWNFIR